MWLKEHNIANGVARIYGQHGLGSAWTRSADFDARLTAIVDSSTHISTNNCIGSIQEFNRFVWIAELYTIERIYAACLLHPKCNVANERTSMSAGEVRMSWVDWFCAGSVQTLGLLSSHPPVTMVRALAIIQENYNLDVSKSKKQLRSVISFVGTPIPKVMRQMAAELICHTHELLFLILPTNSYDPSGVTYALVSVLQHQQTNVLLIRVHWDGPSFGTSLLWPAASSQAPLRVLPRAAVVPAPVLTTNRFKLR